MDTVQIKVRTGGLMVPRNYICLMKNPFDGEWEMVTDTIGTFERAVASGKYQEMFQKIVPYMEDHAR